MSLSVTSSVNLKQNTLKSVVLNDDDNEGLLVYDTIGGIFGDNAFSWLSHGPRLEVFDARKGDKVGAWTFGYVLKDLNTEIVCVEEIQRLNGRLPLLAVGVNCNNSGIICVFDFARSKVIRAIHIDEKITSLHVIDDGCDIFSLPGPLSSFDGVLAVGTSGGAVYLIDICRQICEEALTMAGLNEVRDELNPCQLFNITVKDVNRIELQEELAVRNGQHLAIHLNAVFDSTSKHFILKGPKGEDRIYVNKEEVTVSALCYCSQLGSLLVGFNFGAFQLFDLMKLNLVYCSPICDGNIPIVNFVVQEPADDPRVYCYIWAIYSSQEVKPTCLPLAAMYTFSYHSKEYHEGYGVLYQDFNAASIHFQMKLGVPNNFKTTRKIVGGYCINVNSINKGPIAREGCHVASNEDNLSLCLIAWNVCYSNDEMDTFISVFDLNQWYKEQMPRAVHSQLSSNYMVQIKLNDLIYSATDKSDSILNFAADKNSFLMFKRAQRLEEHFCPNSISFRLCCIREADCVFLRNYGVQKTVLAQIQSTGPLCLVEPAEIYHEIVAVGLVPLFIDLPANTPVSTSQQREVILGAALENLLIGWLCNCASQWANGSYLSTGCSLNVLATWIFQRATVLKTNCDTFCRSLFDYSGIRLDNNISSLLTCCTRQLNYLCSLFNFITGRLSEFVPNLELLTEQYQTLQRVVHYFEVLKWFLNVGLLPECSLTAYPRTDDHDRINAPYSAETLTNFYNQRRGILGILNKEQFKSTESVLFIDQLIERGCSNNELQVQWRNDGGNGLYPPPSLQALLRTYLTHDMDLTCKHAIVTYFFLDLVTTLNQEEYKTIVTYLLKFPIVFKVTMSLIKIIQGFWQLDHGDYNNAMGLLLDSAIHKKDLSLWHHKVVLKTFILEKQYNFALLYIKIKQPAFIDDEDILGVISLYVRNNMVDEAFYYERHFSGREREEKFLNHLFNECSKNDSLKPIIYRSLTSKEENFFLRYLMNCKSPKTQDLHVYYHIIRGHYIEAFESHELTIPTQMDNLGLHGKQVSSTRERIMSMLSEIMPELTRNLINLCRKEKSNVWQKVSRPTPMSVFVQSNKTNIHYKSTLIGAALTTAKETFNNTTVNNSRIETESTPFLRTPKVQRDFGNTPSVVIPRILQLDQHLTDNGPSSKRLKMSLGDNNASLSVTTASNLETPIVKRKISRRSIDDTDKAPVVTPHSILKVKSLPRHSPIQDQFGDSLEMFEKLPYTPISTRKSVLNLSPRKALGKSPSVRFEGLQSTSSSSLEVSQMSSVNSPQDTTQQKENESSDEEFYSPPNSPELKEKCEVQAEEKQEMNQVKVTQKLSMEKEETVEPSPSPHILSTPRARRSYRRSLTPVRSSPRLSAVKEHEPATSLLEQDNSNIVLIPPQDESSFSPSEANILTEEKSITINETSNLPSMLPKLRPRKSLCRKVLESNTFIKDSSSPLASPRSRRSQQKESSKILEEKETVTTFTQYEDGTQTHQATLSRRHNLTTSIIESDLDNSLGDSSARSIRTEMIEDNLATSCNTSTNESEWDSMYNLSRGEDNILKLSDSMYEFVNRPLDRNADDKMDVDEDTSTAIGQTENELKLKKEDGLAKVEFGEDDNQTNVDLLIQPKEEEFEKQDENVEKLEEICGDKGNLDEFNAKIEEKTTVKEELNDQIEEIILKQGDEPAEQTGVLELDENGDSSIEEVIPVTNPTSDEDGYTNSLDSNTSSLNREVDPKMNIFEVYDDLNFNDGLLIEKDVVLGENDLFYDQQNTLESVLEEDIVITSTVERNLLTDNSLGSRDLHTAEQKEDSVITIGSSSDEEEKYEEKDSLDSSHSDGELNISSEHHICDSEISESASSEENLSDPEEAKLNLGLCETDAISITSEKSRSLSDLSDNNEKKSRCSSLEDIDSGHQKEPKLFDYFSSDSHSDEISQPELTETKIDDLKKSRKSEGLFHGYILSSEITNENCDEKEATESCNLSRSVQESVVQGLEREPLVFQAAEFDHTVEVSTSVNDKLETEERELRQSGELSHSTLIETEKLKAEKVDDNNLGGIQKAGSEPDQLISIETKEFNEGAQLENQVVQVASNVNDNSDLMDELVYIPVEDERILETVIVTTESEVNLQLEDINNQNMETTSEILLKPDVSNSSQKSFIQPILEEENEISNAIEENYFARESEPNVEEEKNPRTIVTRRLSRSSLNCEQPPEVKALPKSPSRRRSSARDSKTLESTQTIRTRRLSLEQSVTPKRQTRRSSVDTVDPVKTPILNTEGRRSTRSASVPLLLDIGTATEEILIESSKKRKSAKLSKSRKNSVSPLPNFKEEPSVSSSVQNILEDFSSDKRVTRRQMHILQNTTAEITDAGVVECKSKEDSSTKTTSKRRTRSASLHLSESQDLQTQKNVKTDAKQLSRASSVPPLVSIVEEDSIETTPKKAAKGRHLRKQSTASSTSHQDCKFDDADETDTSLSILQPKPSRRLRSNSQSSNISDYSERSRSSALPIIVEEQAATSEMSQTIISDEISTRRITRKQKDLVHKTISELDSDQDKSKEEQNAHKLSVLSESVKPSRRLRSGSQTFEDVQLSDNTSTRKTRASSVPAQMITDDKANKKQMQSELCIVLKRLPSESQINKSPESSPKKPAKRLLRRRSSQNVESAPKEQKDTVEIPRSRSRVKSSSSVISEDLNVLDTSNVETKKEKRNRSLIEEVDASGSVPSKRKRKNSVQK